VPRLYDELAAWWPLLSPASEYVDEAADLLPRLKRVHDPQPATLLELGAGGGSLAFHLKDHFRLTLTDRAPAMLAVSQALTANRCPAGILAAGAFGREIFVGNPEAAGSHL
jgi:hypothetical protein